MYLLDTNVVSELRKAGKGDPRVLAWAGAQASATLYLSAITVEELEIGVRLAERRDPAQGRILREWLETRVLRVFADRILPVDLAVARLSAALHVPDPKPFRDAYLAATAQAHGLTVVTRNVADFEPTGVRLLDPWKHSPPDPPRPPPCDPAAAPARREGEERRATRRRG